MHTRAYHPAGNGAFERLNQTIKRGLQKMMNEKCLEQCDLVFSEVMFVYDTSVHITTAFTPYFPMGGV